MIIKPFYSLALIRCAAGSELCVCGLYIFTQYKKRKVPCNKCNATIRIA